MCITVLINFSTGFSSSDCFIDVTNIEKVDSSTIEFDVFINVQSGQFELTSYQCVFSFNQDISKSKEFSFSYIDSSSQLNDIPPEVGIGVNNSDGDYKLTFASMPGSETISSTKLRIGRFKFTTAGFFNELAPEIKWCYSGKISTILTGTDFVEITELSDYSEGNFGSLNISNIIASETTDTLTSPEKTIDNKGVNDGDPNSRWAARPMPEFLIFDLGTEKNVSQTKFSFYQWDHDRIYQYSILTSNDLINWEEIITDNSSSLSEWTTDIIDRKARYIKLLFLSSNQSDWAGLWEAQIYGNSDTTEVSSQIDSKPLVNIPIRIEDGIGDSDTLFVGIDSSACDSLDSCLGEKQFHTPSNGVFSAWLNIPNSQVASLKDYRYGCNLQDYEYTYQIQYQKGSANNVIIHWNLPVTAKLKIQDAVNGKKIDTVFNYGVDSLIINDPAIYKLNFTVTYLSKVVPVETKSNLTPKDFVLYQNYPNPFNPSTDIRYTIPLASNINITIYNALGERIEEFDQGVKEAGTHDIIWHAADLASGVYFYTINAKSTDGINNFRKTQKMMLLK